MYVYTVFVINSLSFVPFFLSGRAVLCCAVLCCVATRRRGRGRRKKEKGKRSAVLACSLSDIIYIIYIHVFPRPQLAAPYFSSTFFPSFSLPRFSLLSSLFSLESSSPPLLHRRLDPHVQLSRPTFQLRLTRHALVTNMTNDVLL